MLEGHIHAPLFDRHQRGVSLNKRGRRYHTDIQRILADIGTSTARHRA